MRASIAVLASLAVTCSDTTPQATGSARVADSAPVRNPPPVRVSSPAAAQDTMVAPRVQLSQSIAASRNSAIVEAAARVAPAVVSVNVVRRERRVPRSVFDWLWMPRGFEREVQGLGSGFIISPDGVVITNEHVTGGASDIVVTTRDGTDYQATLLGEDPLTDIAVLRIDGGDFRTVPIGTSADLMIGEWVVAIGNPYGYLLGNTEPSVTAGVVSAVGRNIIPSGEDETVYVGMIQTDAAINPGNSGGPLINALGEVVGVNSSIFSASGGSVGVGFAIPIERALRIARELQRYGEVRRSWVGVSVAGSDRLRDWKRTGGLLITAVAGGSPAARAGMRDGDVLVSAGRRLLRTFLDWEAVKLDVSPGDNLRIVFRRDGRERRASVAVQDLPTSLAERVSVLGQIELITVTPPIRQERGIRSEQGALVYEIGAAAGRSTGLQAGDVIFRINRQQITHAEDVQRVFREAAGSRAPIRVYFERSGGRGWTDFYVR